MRLAPGLRLRSGSSCLGVIRSHLAVRARSPSASLRAGSRLAGENASLRDDAIYVEWSVGLRHYAFQNDKS